ncbi:hypothetical protein OsI_29323 [Oryza sativa Indica Group]|uniref:Uncharacterized protein n=1 Tax=Oryza sativa subsp. indica TaxID=39946 RepID=A2YVG6_ORYSI|nr:hypothetical protein OsI_29323 [Oryza sativa Indica Group]
MAAAAAATARSSVAPHASPTLRRSGSSALVISDLVLHQLNLLKDWTMMESVVDDQDKEQRKQASGSLHFLRVLLKILPSLSTLTGIADSVYLLRLQKQALFRRLIGPLTDVLAC